MVHTVVYPPCAAARLPVRMVSLHEKTRLTKMHMDIYEAGNNATPAHIELRYTLQRRQLRSNALYSAVSNEHVALLKAGRTVHHGIFQDAIHENSSERLN